MARRDFRPHDVIRTAFYSLWGVLTLVLIFTVAFLVIRLTQTSEQVAMVTDAARAPRSVGNNADALSGRPVTLYFASPDALRLVPEQRTLPLTENTVENCRIAFAALAAGPQGTAVPVMPTTGAARAFYLLTSGELVIDLARDVESPETRSASAEWLLVQAIVHTLTQPALQASNDRPVSTVRLLFEGSPMADTFPTHIALQDAVRPDPSLLGGE